MVAERIYAEIFESNYRNLKSAMQSKDYRAAKKYLSAATKVLYETAKSSEGKVRETRIQQADALYRQIPQLDRLIREQDRQKSEASREEASGSAKKQAAKSRSASRSPEESVLSGKAGSIGNGKDQSDGRIFAAIDVPDTGFDDVVGLDDVKNAVRAQVIEPRLHPELYEAYHLKPGGGILMYGPPGTGKTMIAKAIAHEVNAKFFSVRCSELVSKYFGGTEQNISALFNAARNEENAVIFFDEFEALAVGRDKNSSTVMQRVVTELLTQMNGIQDDNGKDGKSLLILAATNMPWKLDSAFLRPGRFDERIYVGLPDAEARRGIIEHQIEGVPISSDINMDEIVDATNGFNCADVVHVVTKAKQNAVERDKEKGQQSRLCKSDFNSALDCCTSSVIRNDIEKMMTWRQENG